MTIPTQTETTRLPALSDTTITTLKELRETDIDRFYALIAVLRAEKWPLRAISDSLGVSRSIVSVWERKGKNHPDDSVANLAEKMPEDLPEKLKPVYSSYELSEEEQKRLAELAVEASSVRRYTDMNAPSRQAASELEDLLHFHREKGSSLADLARACKVSRRAVAQRLEKRSWQN